MINFDFLTLRAFFSENADFIKGARLQKIQQPTRRDFILFLRKDGESKKLYINISPNIYHISFMGKENEELRGIIIPKTPPMFCMLLRKYLEGAKISDAIVVENERIIEFYFETYDELSQKRLLCLTVELMGKHSNVILYDKETCLIIGCAHNVGSEKSRYRELQGGLKYIYPPYLSQGKNLPNELKVQFEGLSYEQIINYLSTSVFRPALSGNRYTLFSELIQDSIPMSNVNEMLDTYYSKAQAEINLNASKAKLIELTNSKLKKVNTAISKISALLKKRDNTDKYKLYGELLTSNLYQKKDYQKSIELFDYVNNKNIIIELDEAKSLKENAQRYYKLYSKSKATKEKSEQMLMNLNIEREYYENILYSIHAAEILTDLDDIKIEMGIETHKAKKSDKFLAEKIQINEYDVYIGKNNKQNDYIVSKLAKDDDYWFHTRLCAGSHVLLKTNGVEPNEEVLYECCKLARKYSSATQPSKVGIIYTKAKYLRKPPAAPLGYVTYKNEKEVLI